MKRTLIGTIMFLVPLFALAQTWSISTNVLDWAALGGANISVGTAVSRHFSLHVEASYNPWTFKGDSENQFQLRRQTYNIKMRWWPWHVYSGWWFGLAGQYREYNFGGLWKTKKTEEGDAFGLVVSGGYTLMVTKHLNIEFGASIWGGYKKYNVYDCPRCGHRTVDNDKKAFISPSDIITSLVWVF